MQVAEGLGRGRPDFWQLFIHSLQGHILQAPCWVLRPRNDPILPLPTWLRHVSVIYNCRANSPQFSSWQRQARYHLTGLEAGIEGGAELGSSSAGPLLRPQSSCQAGPQHLYA